MKNWLRILILCGVCIFTASTFVACDILNASEPELPKIPDSDIVGSIPTPPNEATPESPELTEPEVPETPSEPNPEEPTIPEPSVPTGPSEPETPEEQAPHSHSYGEWYQVSPATCTQNGMERCDCYGCEEFQTRTVNAIGHSFDEGKVTKEPSCGEKGETTYTCIRENCGHSYQKEIPATEKHDHSTITQAATCVTEGRITHTCNTCGNVKYETIPATGNHEYESVITIQPSCETVGEQLHTCTICGYSKTEVVSETGHQYEYTIFEPTCQNDGYTLKKCKNCNFSDIIDKKPKTDLHVYDSETHKCICGAQQSPYESLKGSWWILDSNKTHWAIYFKSDNEFETYNYTYDENGEFQPNDLGKYGGLYYTAPDKNNNPTIYMTHLKLESDNVLPGLENPILTYSINENGNYIIVGKFYKNADSTFIFVGYEVI